MTRLITVLFTLAMLNGCASLISSTTSRFADNLNAAMLNQDDPETVRDGAPAYLLLIDGLIEDNPNNPTTLLAGARLYSAYSTVFVDDPARARRMSARAKDYGQRALCIELRGVCKVVDQPFEEFKPSLAQTAVEDVPVLYGFASAWAGWVQTHSDDWNAIAQLPKIKALMRRVVELDETYDGGGAHVYLGVLDTQLPPSLGGKPEQGLAHFQRAIELSEGRNLMTKVLCAKHYARLVFDRETHDELLQQVLAAPAEAPGLTLINTLAQQEARELLGSADEYF